MNTLIDANLSCLEQGISFLEGLDPGIYTRKCAEVFGSSIGGHFRHNIDHYVAFKDGFRSDKIDYDARGRCESVEENPDEAIKVMEQLVQFFRTMDPDELQRWIQIRMDDGGESLWSSTSVQRELQFLLSHTIHHYALVVSIATRYGVREFPERFGVAPSTIHYREQLGA